MASRSALVTGASRGIGKEIALELARNGYRVAVNYYKDPAPMVEETMAELRRRMPDVTLVPFPVVTDKMRDEAWWSSAPTAKLLFSEYLKYIRAQIRFRFGTAGATGSRAP